VRCVSDKNAKNESERRVLRAHEDDRGRRTVREPLLEAHCVTMSAANGSPVPRFFSGFFASSE